MLARLYNLKVGAKILGIVGLCLVALAGVAGTSIWQMSLIGAEIEEIAEQDIPLTESLTKITVHQLEQAINFERALRFGEEMGSSEHAAEQFAEAVKKFEELAEKVNEEIKEGEVIATGAVAAAATAEARQEFQRVLDALKEIETAHGVFDLHAIETMELLAEGQVAEAIERAEAVEAEEEKLNHELEALLTEIEEFTASSAKTAEAHEQTAITLLVGISIGAILFALVASWFLVQRTLTRPLGAVVTALEALITGDTEVEVTVYAEDEIGAVAKALETFRQKIIENNEMTEQAAAEQREKEARGKRLEELNRAFESLVGGVVQAVSDASGEIKAAAETMASTAEETSAQSTAVAAASEQATANVQTVAAATEEMSASVTEIGTQVAQSSDITKRAVAEAESTNVAVQGLAEAAQKIGQVVNLINDIAAQTNLLALNATIEAARAGDAGKGFAVVASEVKSLANQTAKATDEIGSQITGMQGVTDEVVKAIEGIGKTITEVNEIATVIASAVEEQGAATQEIARNVQEAAKGTQEVNENIAGVTTAAGETGSAASQMLASAGELANQSETLRQEVDRFLADIKAA